jgi:7-keto-8-aminopelargonate synthetase-like enzyme
MDNETTAERISRMYEDSGQAAQAAVQQVVGNLTSELRHTYSAQIATEDAVELIRKITTEHGYPVYI